MAESLWTLPFGKHKGEDIEDIPDSYLSWLLDSEWFEKRYPYRIKAVEQELAYREQTGRHIDG